MSGSQDEELEKKKGGHIAQNCDIASFAFRARLVLHRDPRRESYMGWGLEASEILWCFVVVVHPGLGGRTADFSTSLRSGRDDKLGGWGRAQTRVSPLRFAPVEMTSFRGVGWGETQISPLRFAPVEMTSFLGGGGLGRDAGLFTALASVEMTNPRVGFGSEFGAEFGWGLGVRVGVRVGFGGEGGRRVSFGGGYTRPHACCCTPEASVHAVLCCLALVVVLCELCAVSARSAG